MKDILKEKSVTTCTFILAFFVCLIVSGNVYGQNEFIDSLDKIISKTPDNSGKVALLAKKAEKLALSDPEAARSVGYKALEIATLMKSASDSAVSLNQIGRSYYAQGQFAQAADFQSDALQLAKKSADELGLIAKCQNDLAICFTSLGKTDSSLSLLHQAVKNRIKISDSTGAAGSISNIAIIYHDRGDYEEAMLRYEEAKRIFEKLDDQVGLGRIYNNIGTLEIEHGNHTVAMQYMLDALNIFEELGDKHKMLSLTTNLSYLHELHKQNKLVREYNQKTLALAEELGNDYFKAKVLSSEGRLFIEEKEPEKGIPLIREAVTIFSKVEDPASEGNAILYLSDGLSEVGKKDSAILLAEKARGIWDTYGYQFGVAITNTRLANLYNDKELYQESIRYAEEALKLAGEVEADQTRRDAHGELSNAYAGIRDYEKAYYHQDLYKKLNDSLFDAEKTLEIAWLQFDYEKTRETDQLIIDQQEKNKENALVLQRQKFITSGIIAVLLVTGFIAVYLQRKRRTVQQLNKELEAQKKVLEVRNKELFDLNQVKDKIFSIISHDLRSPLTTLINLIDVSNDAEFTQEEIQAYLKELGHQAKHTAGMLDNLLYWVQNQRSSFKIRQEVNDVAHVTHELFNLFSLAARQKNVKLKNEIPSGSKVFADPNSLKLILRNLISNAIKFSSRGGIIEVMQEDASEPNMVSIKIKDYGVGISEERQRNLFDVSGLSKRGTFNEHGIGLGLILVKEFVDKNNGTISVESAPSEGTTFTLTLPASA